MRIEFAPELPISSRAGEIVDAIATRQVVILAGETGSGKTTQIPKMCLAAGRGVSGRIACTQPRRVAALSLSRRVAEELGVAWGREVGCKVRFSDETTRDTVVKFLTDGMLLAEAHSDPLLREYDTIVVDEAHERSLNIDFLLGHLRQLRLQRPDLRIVITSATIDTESFSKAFDDAPVIIVEGRMFPVEVVYAPLDSLGSDAVEGDETEARAEAMHYVDGAVEAAERIASSPGTGDVLVFMPSERDIRETCELLAGRLRSWDIVPLYGRLSNDEQRRIFSPGQKRRVVVATNIAETSLTIPGIRFVVDTGLARVSRYSPQARTRRLPIEPVAQSSADQRKGRCGRVADGVCIRLYSEEDYLARPRFGQPEIQRANLADVILRLKAHRMGDVERFPFISPPASKAIRAGYALLEELGAVEADAGHTLTDLGRDLARLPVDPTVARMVLQATREKALEEVLVIASGLSIQDPRERPEEKRAQADLAHRRFAHPDSDFLTLLRIWDSYHTEVESMTQGRLRAFCRTHHLSYIRMREWRDIHSQLVEVLSQKGSRFPSVFDGARPGADRSLAFDSPGYRAIHRSILSGLLGNVAVLDEENGGYRAAHDRRVALFPGSVLYRRETGQPAKAAQKGAPRRVGRAPRWIMASEITETARLYARTAARIDPAWIVDLGAHLLKVSHSDPTWNEQAGRVMVKRRSRLYGLEVESRSVGYGSVDPAKATEIFIREALVNDTVTWPFDFLAHNRRVREKAEALLTRSRSAGYLSLDEAIYRFYSERLPAVSSVAELVDIVRERRANEPSYLMIDEEDLRDPDAALPDTGAFPESVPVDNRVLPLHYAYKPGKDDDGVTLEVNVRDATALTEAAVDWAVPGHLEDKVEHLLRALPKEQRKLFVPLPESVRRLSAAVLARDRLTDRRETVAEALAAVISETSGFTPDRRAWEAKPLVDHLRVRVRIVDDKGRELAAGRELGIVRQQLDEKRRADSIAVAREDPDSWRRARERWEKPAQQKWAFGDLPDKVVVAVEAGVEIAAFVGLLSMEGGVGVRLFRDREKAQEATRQGLEALMALELRHDLGWLHRDLRSLASLGPLLALFKSADLLVEDAYLCIRAFACARPIGVLSAAAFAECVARAKADLRGLVPSFVDRLREIALLKSELLVEKNPYPGLARDLERLVGADFLRQVPYGQLAHFPRYLKAMKLRVTKRRQNPGRDDERAAEVALFESRLGGKLKWLLEEYRVSLFAQELGTAVAVSKVKLERAASGTVAPQAAPAAKPESPAPAPRPAAKAQPIKNLGALDRLFPKSG